MPRSTRVHPLRMHNELSSYPEKSTYCVKYFIFFMNILFWIVSCLILAIASYAMLEKQEIYGQISRLTTDPAVLLMCIGLVMFMISFTGCIGALRENTCLLKFYSFMLGAMLLLEIAAAILGYVYYNKVRKEMHSTFTTMIDNYLDDPDLQLLIDAVQKGLKCCGSEKYTDWERNVYYNCSSPAIERCSVPYSCCVTEEVNSQCGFGALAIPKSEASRIIFTKGCLEGVEDWFRNNLVLMASIAACLPVIQIIGFCCARRFTSDIKDVLAMQGRS